MHPMEKTSQTQSYFTFKSFRLAISGATYPGVPHLGNGYTSNLVYVANPKSTTFNVCRLLGSLNIIFSGFKSLCIMPLECILAITLIIYYSYSGYTYP